MVAKDLDANRLIVTQGTDHTALYTDALTASQANWISGMPTLPMSCKAKTRYRQPDQGCRVELTPDGLLQVVFDQPQRAVTPGQYVVFYQGDVCLGGAVIERSFNLNV